MTLSRVCHRWKNIHIRSAQSFLDTNNSIAPVSFPSSKQEMVGNSTMNLQKFGDGCKIVASHTSVAGM
jgi:hypothetical protein